MTSSSITIESAFSFRPGETFPSYDQFLTRLEQHSQRDLVHYWRRDSRTIEGASMKTSCPIQPALRYYSVRYACIFGGQKFETKATGAKRVRSSLRSNCPAFISLRASKCGQLLQVVAVCNVHNHEVGSQQIAHSKKLPPDVRQKVLELFFYGVDRKLVIQYVHVITRKELSSKDICNLAASLKRNTEFQDMLEDPERTAALTKELMRIVQDGVTYIEDDIKGELTDDPEHDEMLEERLLDETDDYESYKTEITRQESFEVDENPEELVVQQLIEVKAVQIPIANEEELPEVIVPQTIDTSHQRQVIGECPAPVKNSNRNRIRWKSERCFACGSNNRLVRAQLEVLRARRNKLREETGILRLKQRKLQLEIEALNKS